MKKLAKFLDVSPKSAADIVSVADGAMRYIEAEVKAILAVPKGEKRTLLNTLAPWNRIAIAAADAALRAGLFSAVHPKKEIRDAGEQTEQRLSDFFSKLYLRRDLHDALSAVAPAGLDSPAKRFREKELLDFRLTGVAKPLAVRLEIKKLIAKGVKLGQAFDRNIKDDVRSVILRAEDLDGLPEDYRKAHAPDKAGAVRIATTYPDYVPFMKYAKSGEGRRKLYLLFMNRGWPKNEAAFKDLLAVRRRQAELLGFQHWADYVTANKMTGSAKIVESFLNRVANLTGKRAKKDYAMLVARKKKDFPAALSTAGSAIAGWEVSYYDNLAANEMAGIDSREVRNYFRFDRVKQGVFDTTERLFDLSYKRVRVPTWHAEVEAYDVYRGKTCIGRFYLDLHPREGKFNHAAEFDIRPGIANLQLPEAALVCNFSKGIMDHSEVTTFFHEFGHLMHALLGGNHAWARFSGVATERDFVEAPSQMLEEWAWDYPTLTRFAKHAKTGKPIGKDIVARMRKAQNFGKGMFQRTQIFYAFLSLHYHTGKIRSRADLLKIQKREQKKSSMFAYVPGTHFYTGFGHLNGYSAVYYTYLWSHAISFDLFSAFKKRGMYDVATSRRYRDRVLAMGGSKPAVELIRDFLGRKWNLSEFQRWLEK